MTDRAGPPRIVYATLPTARHSGGVQVLGRHVELLRSAGHDAWLWLPGERPAWFDPQIPTLQAPTLDVGAGDLLVLPEVPLVPGRDPAPGARKVIVNQNHFYTYAAAPPGPETPYPGWDPAPAVWTVSDEARDVLTALHPELPVTVVPNPVDADRFVPLPTTSAAVAWFPRKRPREASVVHRLLRADPRFAGVGLHPIADLPSAEVATTLGTATVFVAFGHTEGFGLPVVEAMLAGCLVVGYDGGGGHALFDAPGAWRVPEQRPLLLVDRVAEALTRPDAAELAAANRTWARARYHPGVTLGALRPAVAAALARPGAAARAVHPHVWLDALAPNFHLTG